MAVKEEESIIIPSNFLLGKVYAMSAPHPILNHISVCDLASRFAGRKGFNIEVLRIDNGSGSSTIKSPFIDGIHCICDDPTVIEIVGYASDPSHYTPSAVLGDSKGTYPDRFTAILHKGTGTLWYLWQLNDVAPVSLWERRQAIASEIEIKGSMPSLHEMSMAFHDRHPVGFEIFDEGRIRNIRTIINSLVIRDKDILGFRGLSKEGYDPRGIYWPYLVMGDISMADGSGSLSIMNMYEDRVV